MQKKKLGKIGKQQTKILLRIELYKINNDNQVIFNHQDLNFVQRRRVSRDFYTFLIQTAYKDDNIFHFQET